MTKMQISPILKKLDYLLQSSFAKIPQNKNIGVLFSGGIDSSLVAWYAIKNNLSPTLYTFGTEYSKDYFFANRLAKDLGLPFEYLSLTKNDIENSIGQINLLLKKISIENNLMQISLSIGIFLISSLAQKKGVGLFLSGQGSDELFGGYNKYLKLLSDEKALREQMEIDTYNLFKIDVIRDLTMAKESGINMYFPYLDKEFISFVQTLPLGLKINDQARKWLIRELGKRNGLPEYIFTRPKNALQYSSGIQKITEKIIKSGNDCRS